MQLLRGMLSGQTTYTGPFHVSVDVTRRCNLQCLFCPIHSPIADKPAFKEKDLKDMPFGQFEKLCDDLSMMGTDLIILEGEGEPLLHNRIFDFISVIKSKGMDAMLLTNGVLLNETSIRSLVEVRLDFLKVSLWASSAEEYKETHPNDSPENFGEIVKGLRLLTSLKSKKKTKVPCVELYHLLTRRNLQTLDAVAELAHETACNGIWFSPLHDIGGHFSEFTFPPAEKGSLFLSLKRLKKQLKSLSVNHNIDYTLQRYRIGEAVWEKLPCYIGWYHARIRVDGRVLPCFWYDISMGNLNETTFYEICKGLSYRMFRKEVKTREGLTRVSAHCDCRFCSHVVNNKRIHNIVRWIPAGAFRH